MRDELFDPNRSMKLAFVLRLYSAHVENLLLLYTSHVPNQSASFSVKDLNVVDVISTHMS